jgi:hypothetical protein
LADSNLAGSYLFLTQLGAANLSRTVGLTQGQIEVACGTAETKLPAGLTQPKSWPCAFQDID